MHHDTYCQSKKDVTIGTIGQRMQVPMMISVFEQGLLNTFVIYYEVDIKTIWCGEQGIKDKEKFELFVHHIPTYLL